MHGSDVLLLLVGAAEKTSDTRVAVFPDGAVSGIRRTSEGWTVRRPDKGVVSVYPTLWRLKACLRSAGVRIKTLR
jgi:hypothetical protein